MQSISDVPNLLLIGGPKCGTTSLLTWLRKHPEIYHPWEKIPISASESGFLLGGVSDLPFSPTKPKGTLILPNEINMDRYKQESWIIDKSPQHLYSTKALDSVANLLPNSKVVITLRDPYDLFISWHGEMNKSINYDVSLEELLAAIEEKSWQANTNDSDTWSFLTYPQYSSFVKLWIDKLGEDRVRVITLSNISKNPAFVLQSLSKWLDIDSEKMPNDFTIKNVSGILSINPVRKILRNPPKIFFLLARIFLPSRTLRKILIDPIRRLGWKYVPSPKSTISKEIEVRVRTKLSKDIEFFENLHDHVSPKVLINYDLS